MINETQLNTNIKSLLWLTCSGRLLSDCMVQVYGPADKTSYFFSTNTVTSSENMAAHNTVIFKIYSWNPPGILHLKYGYYLIFQMKVKCELE